MCKGFVQAFNGDNLKRHYAQKHAAKSGSYQGLCCKENEQSGTRVCLLNKKLFFFF